MSAAPEPNSFGIGPQSCVHCGYELTGLSVPTNCPECGKAHLGSLNLKGLGLPPIPVVLMLSISMLLPLGMFAMQGFRIPGWVVVALWTLGCPVCVVAFLWLRIRLRRGTESFIFGPNQLLGPWNLLSKVTPLSSDTPVSVTRYWLGGTLVRVHQTFLPLQLWMPGDRVDSVLAGLREVFEKAPESNRPTVRDGHS